MEKSFIIFLSLFAFLYEPISGDRYAAVVELEELVKLERVLRGKLEEYVKLEKNRIQRLKTFAQNVRDVRNTTQKSDSDLEDSPEEAVSVAKRLATGWKEIGQVFSEDLAKGECLFLIQIENMFCVIALMCGRMLIMLRGRVVSRNEKCNKSFA